MPAVVHRKAPRSTAVDSRAVKRTADRMLRAIDRQSAELSVLLTDDATIRGLNGQYRNRDRATDVLAFPMEDEPDVRMPGAPELLGDVVISIDTAARQARKARRSLFDEIAHLLAHGLLHLVGYDHRTDAEERRMNAETRRLLASIARPKRLRRT